MIRLLALLLVSFVGIAPVAAADAPRVRAAAHEPAGKPAYGRIVFDWPTAVGYSAAVEGGRLVVRFAAPFDGPLDAVTRYLGDYVSGAAVEDGGRTVVFPLKSDFRLKSYADGGTVVLDLMSSAAAPARAESPAPSGAQTSAPAKTETPPAQAADKPAATKPAAAKPQAAPAPAAGGPVLAVRSGDHEGFGRLVFDWTRNVDYRVTHDGTRAAIRFDQPAKVDVAALTERLPKTITAAALGTEAGALILELTIAENSRVRHFRSGTRVVFDVLEPSGARATQRAADASASEGKPAGSAKPATGDPQPTASSATHVEAPATAARGASPASATPSASAGAQPTVAPRVPAQNGAPAGAPPANLLARNGTAAAQAPEVASSDAQPSLDEILAAIGGMARPQTAAPAAPTSAAPPPPAQAQPKAAAGRLTIHPLGNVNELTGLRIAMPAAMGGAVYERSGSLWIMIDGRAALDFAGTWPRNAPKPQLVSTIATDILLLRWRLPDDKYPALRREGQDWLVELANAPTHPPTDIRPETHLAAAAGPRIVLRGASFGAVRELLDPEVGDRVWIVPMAVDGYGTAAERRFAELHMPMTLQGLVIHPLNDEITVRNVPEGIEVTMPGGLHLSGNVAAAQPDTQKSPATAATRGGSAGQTPLPALATRSERLFDFDAWGAGKRGFFDRKRELQRAVIEAPGPRRNAARLALARFFFAHGYAADALGILQVIEQDDAEAVKDMAFRALRGASRYLAGDYAEAAVDLFDGALDVERETALWRAALLASQHDWISASRYFSQADKVLRLYPTDLRLRFGMLAAEAAFMTGDGGLAKFHLDTLTRMNPSRPWMDQIDYLQGLILEKARDIDAAAATWERAMAGVHRPSKAKARYARAVMLLETKRITPGEAIAQLEMLRFAWRGDEIELTVLKRLGELYLAVADYRNGLQSLRDAVSYFPKAPETPAIEAKMRAAFAALYVGGEADKLPPLAALSLHDDFHDLAPAGEAGDVAAAKLVDRLVGVELLDRAADVLKQQIESRLKGAALAEAVNRLGLIHLLARQPEEAAAVLNGRMPPEATPTAVAQRRQLKARAFGELTRYKDALALIEGDNSEDADRLRAEIGWRTQNWPLAAYAFARLVPPADKAMSDLDRQTVLRLAIAQALKNDPAALKDLRKTYGDAMAQSAFKEAFDLVTAPGGGPAVNLRAITKQVGEVDQFRAFLTSYRDKLLSHRETPVKPLTATTPAVRTQTASN